VVPDNLASELASYSNRRNRASQLIEVCVMSARYIQASVRQIDSLFSQTREVRKERGTKAKDCVGLTTDIGHFPGNRNVQHILRAAECVARQFTGGWIEASHDHARIQSSG